MTAPAARTAYSTTDSLKKRYLYKLGGGFLGMAMGGAIQALVPRFLGPAAFGDYNFLSDFFVQVTNFLDMGTSLGFYTKLSQRPEEPGIVKFYLLFVLSLSGALLLATAAASASPVASLLWPGQRPAYVLMGAVLGVLLWSTSVLNKMTDAYGLTVHAEISRAAQEALALALIVPIIWLGRFNLAAYFVYQYAVTIFLAAAYVRLNARGGHPVPRSLRMPAAQLKTYAVEFYEYSHPLFTYAVTVLLAGILGRWMLQVFAGSVQQGYFGLSNQIGAMCFLSAGAMTPLLTREFSIAHKENDRDAIALLFRKHIPLLYSVTAYFSCFVALQAAAVIAIFGGREYVQAGPAVVIMAVAPVLQVYGQMSGSLFFATDRTDLYRNVGIFTMLAGLAANYVFLAPRHAGGLGMGALGLAVATLLTRYLSVNIQLYLNARFLRLPFARYLAHQAACVAALLALAYASKHLASALVGPSAPWLAAFLLAGVVYTAAAAAACLAWPRLFGLTPELLHSIKAAAAEKVSGLAKGAF